MGDISLNTCWPAKIRVPHRLLVLGTVLAAACGLCATTLTPAAKADSIAHALRLEGALGLFVGEPQSSKFDLGGGFGLGYELRLIPHLGIEAHYSSFFFPTAAADASESFGGHHAPALGLRLHPLPDLELGDLWIGAAGLVSFTGDVARGGFQVGLGFEFKLHDNVRAGPFWRYVHVVQPDNDSLGSADGKFMSVGISLALVFGGESAPSDRDEDGIADERDACPDDPEDLDGVEDQDGCPEHDRDGDGIADAADQCPDDPEDRDGFEDTDGCPDPDNDSDGRPDADDRCPNNAEDPDGFEDEDGCPDPDNDGDQVADESDRCPTEAEDRDGFQDEDGCPEPDNDQDGIADAEDQCPREPGAADNNGCPRSLRVEEGRIIILQRIEFAVGRATLRRSAHAILGEVRAVLETNPQIQNLRVEGHTDNRGREDRNLELSQQRADAVVAWLVERGIAAERLSAQGFGLTRPIETNDTRRGRALNRRVEFHIVEPASSE